MIFSPMVEGIRHEIEPGEMVLVERFPTSQVMTPLDLVMVLHREEVAADRLAQAERLLEKLTADRGWVTAMQRQEWECGWCLVRNKTIHSFPHAKDCPISLARAFLAGRSGAES